MASDSGKSGLRGQLGYIHALRGVAILIIVAAHTNSFAPHDGNIAQTLYRAFFREGTALFILISGFLFQHLSPGYEAKRFRILKLRNVALPYVVMSMPAIALYVAVLSTHDRIDLATLHAHSAIYQIGYFLWTGADLMPFWFIPVILMIFACYPLLRFLAESPALKYIAVLCFISLIFTQRPLNNLDPIAALVHFMPVYVIGMALHRYRECWMRWSGSYRWELIGLFLAATAAACIFRDPYACSSVAIVAKLAFFMLMCSRLYSVDFVTLADRSVTLRTLNYLATLSFGIYFVHGYVASAVARSPLSFVIDNGWASVAMGIINTVFVVAVSVAIVEAVRLLARSRSRMIVGA